MRTDSAISLPMLPITCFPCSQWKSLFDCARPQKAPRAMHIHFRFDFDGIQYRGAAKRSSSSILWIGSFLCVKEWKQDKLLFVWSFENANSDDEYHVLTWLNDAIECKLQLLDLEFVLNKEGVFFLPLGVFLCESLMELKVNLHVGILKLLSTDGCCKLQSLSLQGVGIFNQNFGEWVSSSCKHPKLLFPVGIHGIKNISIRSSDLQHLEIRTPASCESDLCCVSISAEMLKLM